MTTLPRHIKNKLFPALNTTNHLVTSDQAIHNCAAYVVDDTSGWCQPLPHPKLPTFWAEGVIRSIDVDAYMQFYSKYGYVECDDGSERQHFDKIAIYASGAEFRM